MKRPTDVLRDEHVLILRALDLLEAAGARLERRQGPDESWWQRLIAWLRGFADRNHHAKEEGVLFPALERAGVPGGEGGPIGVMLEEHGQGRALVAALASPDAAIRAASARAYADLLRAHIDKENGVLFPLADGLLDEDAHRAMAREFDAAADALGADPLPARAERILDELAASLGDVAAPAR